MLSVNLAPWRIINLYSPRLPSLQPGMYKVGVLMMGSETKQQKSTVKEVILEVEAKTKIVNIFQYLLELNKIKNMNVSVSLEKGGVRINQTSTISQVLKYSRPVNGVIKLYCYNNEQNLQESTDKIMLKPSRHEVNNPEVQAAKNTPVLQIHKSKVTKKAEESEPVITKKQKNPEKQAKQEQKAIKFCCC